MRNATRTILSSAALAVCAIFMAAPAEAHDIFTDTLEAQYGLKSVTCKTCHPDNKDRGIHNALGHLLEQAMDVKMRADAGVAARGADEPTMMHEMFHEAEEGGEAAIEAFEADVAAPALLAVWPEIAGASMTVDQQFRLGLMNGTRLEDEAEEALQALFLSLVASENGFTIPAFDIESGDVVPADGG
ncbi:MAG: hypothetical protein AAF456_24435 [Planctomycetota bacterium]